MAKTLAQIQTQIDKLTRQANAQLARDVAGVIGRIRVAIAHYNITPDDLFDTRVVAGKQAAAKRAGNGIVKKAIGAPRYQDGVGHSWTGHGRRPNWFKNAIASGKTVRELEV